MNFKDLAVFLLQPRQFFAHGQDLGGLLHRCDAFVPVLKRGETAVPFDEGQRGVGQDAVKLGIKGIRVFEVVQMGAGLAHALRHHVEGILPMACIAISDAIKGIFLCVDQFKKRFFADCGMLF